jgi:DNA-binding LytR/AlgR family response regulator
MKKIISLLPENTFYRIHKSFIISLDKIDNVEGNLVKVGNAKLPIGNSYRQDFMNFVKNFLAE